MADDDRNQDQSESPSQWEPPAAEGELQPPSAAGELQPPSAAGELQPPSAAGELQPPAVVGELPERLRVHSLARVLGTTSKRVLDALAGLDGRARSPHSSVDQAEAIRVRDALAAADAESAEVPVASETVIAEPMDTTPAEFSAPEPAAHLTFIDPTAAVIIEAEPESRLILEDHSAPPQHAEPAEQPAYMPLFVAPQPVAAVVVDIDDDEAETEDEADEVDGDAPDRPANRRRRRGRRGRGRGRGEQAGADGDDDLRAEGEEGASETADDTDEDDDSDEAGDEESANGEGATRRRRRRRRRRAGTGSDDGDSASPDDPPNTVVHERAPRSKAERSESNEIQGISGSTRLEAKRQRRRDGRDAGRRRPPILTEAEFLARREAVERVMVVREKVRTEPPHQGALYTQIAVLEDGIVVEHFVTSAASASLVGNIYLGIVQNVLPSMEAAFVDIGRGRNGVLYAGEVNWEAAGLGGANRKIEQALKPGDYIVVQVSKDPVGHKGARLTTQVSLAGRYLVYVPGASSTGISRKLPDTERQRLKEILREVVPADAGVIIRTASEGVKEDEIRTDVDRLQERWTAIAEEADRVKGNKAGAAVALYEEPDVLVKVIRDLFNEDFSGLIVSGDHAWETITGYVNSVAPELMSKLTKYESAGPDVFAVHRIDEQLTKAMDRKVWLPSGGTLVIDRTEAMTVVDVNTGKFTGAGGNLEQTVTKNNLEAAEEIVRQLRLRDIGGIIVIDFIDMVLESNRDLVLRRLTEALARDRTRHQVSEVTSLGLVQLTRKRLGTGLVEAFSTTCPHCSGRGIMLHADPVDNASAPARKTEPAAAGGAGGRRSRRGRRGKAEEPAVARIPVHVPGEHPMFKAMAAAKTDDDESDDDLGPDELGGEFEGEEVAAAQAMADLGLPEDLDEDDDLADEDDEDLDDDDEDDDDDDEDDDVELDEVDDDAIDDDEIEEDESLEVVAIAPEAPAPEPTVAGRRPRRRAAARPAGPPTLDH